MGLMFTGVALGPTIGSFMIRLTGKTISVFVAATVVHAIYASYVAFIVPESLSEEKQQEARISYHNQDKQSGFKRLFQFLRPLEVFSPFFTANEQTPPKGKRTDWNLTLVALGFGFTSSVMVSFVQYRHNLATHSSLGIHTLQVPVCCKDVWLDNRNCKSMH
jgi:hypothetical protein